MHRGVIWLGRLIPCPLSTVHAARYRALRGNIESRRGLLCKETRGLIIGIKTSNRYANCLARRDSTVSSDTHTETVEGLGGRDNLRIDCLFLPLNPPGSLHHVDVATPCCTVDTG